MGKQNSKKDMSNNLKTVLENSKNETLKSLAKDFNEGDAITGGEWVKIKTKFSKSGELTPSSMTDGEE